MAKRSSSSSSAGFLFKALSPSYYLRKPHRLAFLCLFIVIILFVGVDRQYNSRELEVHSIASVTGNPRANCVNTCMLVKLVAYIIFQSFCLRCILQTDTLSHEGRMYDMYKEQLPAGSACLLVCLLSNLSSLTRDIRHAY